MIRVWGNPWRGGGESVEGVRGSLIGEGPRVMEGLIDVVMEAVDEGNADLISGDIGDMGCRSVEAYKGDVKMGRINWWFTYRGGGGAASGGMDGVFDCSWCRKRAFIGTAVVVI